MTFSHFDLRLFVTADTVVNGDAVVELSERFLAELLLPYVAPTTLYTRRGAENARMNMGEFSGRWKAAARKLASGQYGTVWIDAADVREPARSVRFVARVNATAGQERQTTGDISVTCSPDYLREVAELARRLELPAPPANPPHPMPVAYTGQIDFNLDTFSCTGRGIKGAFWANFLSACYVQLAGGEDALRAQLPAMRIDPLGAGALLIVATASPIPDDSEENRQRFTMLFRALQPAFISGEEAGPGKRELLGPFYRERPRDLA